jgi:pyruvate dehydrogenase E1 component
MIPFYTYYSMFGLQRIGDLAWAAGDMRARGFLLGGTAGRTTLNGEGLQHEDGHSHVLASTIPNCIPYDPTFAHEVAVIMHDGLKRMVTNQEDVFYYITLMNENYSHPGLKPGQEEGIIKGLYLLQPGDKDSKHRVQLLGSGTILRESIFAAELLKNDWDIAADVWSAPSFTLLARDGQDAERWNLVHPTDAPRVPYVTQCLAQSTGPIVATTDYMRTFAEQIRGFIPKNRSYRVLGTDGFGRSDSRAKLREFFEVNRYYVTVAALKALADEGVISASVVSQAITKYGLNPNKPNPVTV